MPPANNLVSATNRRHIALNSIASPTSGDYGIMQFQQEPAFAPNSSMATALPGTGHRSSRNRPAGRTTRFEDDFGQRDSRFDMLSPDAREKMHRLEQEILQNDGLSKRMKQELNDKLIKSVLLNPSNFAPKHRRPLQDSARSMLSS